MAGTADHAGDDQYRPTLDTRGERRCRSRATLLRACAAGRCLRRLLSHHSVDHSLVAAYVAAEDQHWLHTQFRQEPMKQKITGFDKDDEDHWRAILECGHRQHVRHDPPMTSREWILTSEGRDSRLGIELNCKRCDEEADSVDE